MEKLLSEIQKLSKKQACLYSLAVCFCVFYLVTLAPLLSGNSRAAVMANDSAGALPTGTQISVSTLPPDGRLPLASKSSQLGAFSAIGIFSAPAEIKFVCEGEKNIGYFRWSFGDKYSTDGRNTASGPNPRTYHTYSKGGTYHVAVYGYATNEDFEKNVIADSRALDIIIGAPVISPTGWIWPTDGRITSRIGWRWGYEMHEGIDIANRLGTPIVAARDGVVAKTNTSGWGGGYGKYVVIRHADGYYSIYGHLNRVMAKKGDHVLAGEKIGEMGTTGRSTGVHLHFGIGPTIMVDRNVQNPLKLLPKR